MSRASPYAHSLIPMNWSTMERENYKPTCASISFTGIFFTQTWRESPFSINYMRFREILYSPIKMGCLLATYFVSTFTLGYVLAKSFKFSLIQVLDITLISCVLPHICTTTTILTITNNQSVQKVVTSRTHNYFLT